MKARLQISSEVDFEVPYDGERRMWMAVILSGLREKARCLRIQDKIKAGIHVNAQTEQAATTQLKELEWFFLEEEDEPYSLSWICAHLSENGDGLKHLFREEFNRNSYATLERRFFRNAHAGHHNGGRKKKQATCGEKVFTVNKQN